jgi:DNA-binding response OmpR family regulator
MKRNVILVVEDEESSASALRTCFEARGDYLVEIACNGYDALRYLGTSVPHVLLLAATLPDLSTRELCRVVRSRERTEGLPIIVLGERADGIGLVEALEIGADDYVTRPLNQRELEARLKALLRRRPLARHPECDRFTGVHLDVDFGAVTVAVDDRLVRLTRRELQLLRFLVRHKNRVVGREVLLANVWPAKGHDCRVVDSAIYKLRSKLRQAGRQIETITGFGYTFVEPPGEPGSEQRRMP